MGGGRERRERREEREEEGRGEEKSAVGESIQVLSKVLRPLVEIGMISLSPRLLVHRSPLLR